MLREAKPLGGAARLCNNTEERSNNMELKQFLINAKLNSYSIGREGMNLPDGSKELTFQEHEFTYRDRYIGENPFIGEEIVWQAERLIWGMNFYGRVVSDVVPADQVYTFLQKAMRQVKEDRPFRGPDTFKDQDFEYSDESQGTVEVFVGVERIFYKGQEVYRLNYHGGSVKTE
jgi:hypothetical protein